MQPNHVKHLYDSNKIALGSYFTFADVRAVEVAAAAGLDFVRFDQYHVPYSYEALEHRVQAAYSYNLTPWARVANDALTIMSVLDLGVQALTIPNVHDVAAAKRAVAATFYPPKGRREMSRPLRSLGLSTVQFIEWTNDEVIVSCQIEDREAVANCRDIVRVDGVGMVQTGRADLSLSFGVPGQHAHRKVVEAEKRIVGTALDAGKQVSLTLRITDEDIEGAARWIQEGVRVITLDTDYRVLMRAYAGAVGRVRAIGEAI
jgi:4-hydroxy-2-oxoheptanedioate aldolase